MPRIKGIIFDFDGLICDTETTEMRAWVTLYADYQIPFPYEIYHQTIGAVYNDEGPLRYLQSRLGSDFDYEKAKTKYQEYHNELSSSEPLRPGVLNYLENANKLKLGIGLASSSPRTWVDNHIRRLGVERYFQCIKTSDDVTRVKPDPELFLAAVNCLGLIPGETIALEDSINGVKAAKSAGLITVAVPNEVTRIFEFDGVDFLIYSLENVPLKELVNHFERGK